MCGCAFDRGRARARGSACTSLTRRRDLDGVFVLFKAFTNEGGGLSICAMLLRPVCQRYVSSSLVHPGLPLIYCPDRAPCREGRGVGKTLILNPRVSCAGRSYERSSDTELSTMAFRSPGGLGVKPNRRQPRSETSSDGSSSTLQLGEGANFAGLDFRKGAPVVTNAGLSVPGHSSPSMAKGFAQATLYGL